MGEERVELRWLDVGRCRAGRLGGSSLIEAIGL
jgi:hypothetical protein